MKSPRFIALFLLLSVSLFAQHTVAKSDGPKSSIDEQPAVVSAVAPYFPPIALAAHATGKVIIEVKINAKGVVATTKAVSGHPLLQKACENTAKRWRFAESKDSQSVRTARLTFIFSYLENKPTEGEHDLITFTPPYQVELSKSLVVVDRETD